MAEKLIQKLIFGKYKILKLLGNGAFGIVFKGKNVLNGESVAIKVEEWKKQGNILEDEAYNLFLLKGNGFPEVKSFGKLGKFKILVETLLGDSLYEISKKINKTFYLKDICMIGIQLIERLEYIHSKYIIHRDIKPENLLVDKQTKRYIYLIDFGLAKKYRSGRTGNHIKFFLHKQLTGTPRYASINATKGAEQSRRDDLESAGYVLIYLAKNHLPWQGLKEKDRIKRYKQIYMIKKNIEPEKLCLGLPNEFCEYIKYVKKLQFEEEPNYKYLKGLFLNFLNKNGIENDLNFSWLTKEDRKYPLNSVKISINKKRKASPQVRILKNIENNLEKEKKIGQFNNNSSNSSNNLLLNNNSLNNLSKLENNNDKSISQLVQLNESLNIEDDEVINNVEKNIKNINILENTNNSSNKNIKTNLDENVMKEIKKYSNSNIGNKKENNIQSIPIIFDPINGSFKSMSVKGINQKRISNERMKKENNNLDSKNTNKKKNKRKIKITPKKSNSQNKFFEMINNTENKNINNRKNNNIISPQENLKIYLETNASKQKNNINHYKVTQNIINKNMKVNKSDKEKTKFLNNKKLIEIKNNPKMNHSQKNNYIFFNNLDLAKKLINLNNNNSNKQKNENKNKNKIKKIINKSPNNYINIHDINKRLILNINLNNNTINKKGMSNDNDTKSGNISNRNKIYFSNNNSLDKNNKIIIKDNSLNIKNSYDDLLNSNNNNKQKIYIYDYIKTPKVKNINSKFNLDMNLIKKFHHKLNPNLFEYTSPGIIKKYKIINNNQNINQFNQTLNKINSFNDSNINNMNFNFQPNNALIFYKRSNSNSELLNRKSNKLNSTNENFNNKRIILSTNIYNNEKNDFFQNQHDTFVYTDRIDYRNNLLNYKVNNEMLYPRSAFNYNNNSDRNIYL